MTGAPPEFDSVDGVRFVGPPEGWRPPAEAARAILRVVMAVKERQQERRESAA